MVEHAALVKLVRVFAPWRPLGDALTLEFQQFWLNRAGDRGNDFVLKLEQLG